MTAPGLHECSFPVTAPHSVARPGPCQVCRKTWLQNGLEVEFESVCRRIAAAYPLPDPPGPAGIRFFSESDSRSWWHAVPADRAREAVARRGLRPHAMAACGRTVTLALGRMAQWPQTGAGMTVPEYWRCADCTWQVAADESFLGARAAGLAPSPDDQEALARLGIPPLLAQQTATALIAAAEDPDRTGMPPGELIQLLAAVDWHQPRVSRSALCEEGECGHAPDRDLEEEWQGPGPECPVSAICWRCTLTAGPWAAAYEGKVLGGCLVSAPCTLMAGLAARAEWERGEAR